MRQLEGLLESHGLSEADIDRATSPNDVMFNGNMVAYLLGGLGSLDALRRGQRAAGLAAVDSILDFGCGHGRELRVLKLAYPEARLVGCDVDRDAVEFCRRVLEAETFTASPDPRDTEMDERFDLIWAGSVLTHVGAGRWPLFLQWFESHLTPAGAAVFTFHGQGAADLVRSGGVDLGLGPAQERLMEQFDRDGFGYVDYPGIEDYGVSMTSFEWVRVMVESHTGLRIADHAERGWGAHDVLTLTIGRP